MKENEKRSRDIDNSMAVFRAKQYDSLSFTNLRNVLLKFIKVKIFPEISRVVDAPNLRVSEKKVSEHDEEQCGQEKISQRNFRHGKHLCK
jgi:hypothetical protein